jgi:hypothetical protein
MKLSTIFSLAKHDIQEGAEDFICLAIKYNNTTPKEDRWRAIDVIFERINGRPRNREEREERDTGNSVCEWLWENGHAKAGELNSAALREYRLRWLDALIAEFEAKGD